MNLMELLSGAMRGLDPNSAVRPGEMKTLQDDEELKRILEQYKKLGLGSGQVGKKLDPMSVARPTEISAGNWAPREQNMFRIGETPEESMSPEQAKQIQDLLATWKMMQQNPDKSGFDSRGWE